MIGMNQSILEKNLGEAMRRNYEQKKAAGAILRITLGDGVCYEHAEGYADVGAQTPLNGKSIFRAYSMSKPITMTALMRLYERGLMSPEDRLCDFFPAVADMPVAVEREDGTVEYEKQRSPITIKNLFTMTSGVSYPDDEDAGARSMLAAMEKLGEDMPPLMELMDVLPRECALSFQPGTRWKYGFSHDVLGAVIEKASGMPFGEYLRQNVFEPLRMEDTGFYVPEGKRERFVTAYEVENGEYKSLVDSGEYTLCYYQKPAFESGGGGLVTTLDDYSRFCQMLLGGGTYDGARLLGRKTVEMMSTNQLSDEQMQTFGWRERGYGYGVGMRVHLRPWLTNGSVGEFGWDGMMGTWMVIDPAEGMTVVYLQNMFPYAPTGLRLMPVIYGAME